MKVVFIREHTDPDGKQHRPGEVIDVPDALGKHLVDKGVARERKEERGPEETKDDDDEPMERR